jgi:hypothetical protein
MPAVPFFETPNTASAGCATTAYKVYWLWFRLQLLDCLRGKGDQSMPLVHIKPLLAEAKAKGYAVAAFNPFDYASLKVMVAATEELNAPVIVQTSVKTIDYYGHRALVEWLREIAQFGGTHRAGEVLFEVA